MTTATSRMDTTIARIAADILLRSGNAGESVDVAAGMLGAGMALAFHAPEWAQAHLAEWSEAAIREVGPELAEKYRREVVRDYEGTCRRFPVARDG